MKFALKRKNTGQAAILIIFVLGMISLLIGISLEKTGFSESLFGRAGVDSTKAFYAANSGVEEAFYKIQMDSAFTGSLPVINIDTGTAEVIVDNKTPGDDTVKLITSTGKWGKYTRRVKVEVEKSSTKPGFLHAVLAGTGGFELENNTKIIGDVFSNASIEGGTSQKFKDDDDCKSTAFIDGNATALSEITNLDGSGNGVCISKDATADKLLFCHISQTGNYITAHTPSDCLSINPAIKITDPIDSFDLPEMGEADMKNNLEIKGEKFYGDCELDGSGGLNDCSKGTGKIGTIIIYGNLTVSSSFTVTGPVYVADPNPSDGTVEGNVTIEQNNTVSLDPDIINDSEGVSQLIAAEGVINSNQNVDFTSGNGKFLLFISTYLQDPPPTELCTDPSIHIYPNVNSVLFYAKKGCILISPVTGSSIFHGAVVGQKIKLEVNSVLEYDPLLKDAVFGITRGGGWLTNYFEEF